MDMLAGTPPQGDTRRLQEMGAVSPAAQRGGKPVEQQRIRLPEGIQAYEHVRMRVTLCCAMCDVALWNGLCSICKQTRAGLQLRRTL